MPDNVNIPNVVPETTERLEDATEDLTDLLKAATATFKRAGDHLARLLEEGVALHPIEALKEVPAAASDVASGAGEAAGDAAHAGGQVVAAAPAVVSDTLETTGHAAGASTGVVRRGVRYTLRKKRR